MEATGWDYPTLMATPQRVVDEKMLILNTMSKYRQQKAEAEKVVE
jgi:hypothetical protein